jgi:glycine/D-amino acid oxidase-like deaminating enzyme
MMMPATTTTTTTISTETVFDIVVVGAGILGISSAYHLKKNNPSKTILVIDRYGDVGQGNTGRSNAMFRNTFTSMDNQILTDSSIDFYLDTQNQNADIGVDVIGYLWVMSDRQLSASRQHIEKMKDNGIELKFYDRDQLGRALPALATGLGGSEQAQLMDLEDVSGAYLGVKCGRLAPDRLAGYYRDRFTELGGLISFKTEAEQLLFGARNSIGIDGEPFVWQEAEVRGVRMTDDRELKAKTIVVAGGAWNNELLDPVGIDGHVKAKKRQLFALTAEGDALRDLLWLNGFNSSGTLPFVILPKSGLFLKPVKESSEFWVGCEDEIKRPFITVPEHSLDHYQPEPAYYEMNIHQILRQYLPAFEGSRPTRMWAGLYSYNTLDNMPYVFAEHGLIAVGGDSGSGVMKADSLGRITDAVYREGENAQAELYGGRNYQASRMGFRSRRVEREEWVL